MSALIAPLADEALTPAVGAAITRAQHAGALSSTVLPRIWARRPELALAQVELHTRFYDSATLPGRTLELVRLRIAALNACQVCQTSRKDDDVTEDDVACLNDDDGRFSLAERAALSFASTLAADHLSIGPDQIDSLRTYFTDDQIAELGMFAALMLGSGRLAYAFRAFEG